MVTKQFSHTGPMVVLRSSSTAELLGADPHLQEPGEATGESQDGISVDPGGWLGALQRKLKVALFLLASPVTPLSPRLQTCLICQASFSLQ